MEMTTEHEVMPDASAFADLLGPDLAGSGSDGKRVPFKAVRLPPLRVRTGQVVASDGLILDGEPFEQPVPNGDHEMTLALAVLDGDERVAFARLRFATGPVVRWSMATRPGDDPSTLPPGNAFGYGVDSGTGCFADSAAYAAVGGAGVFEQIIAAADDAYRPTCNWVTVLTDLGSYALFSAGSGDGFYASYFGFDAAGKAVSLLTDFRVVKWPGCPVRR